MNLINGDSLRAAQGALPAHVQALQGLDQVGVRRIIVSKVFLANLHTFTHTI
jgi:hypothetical protein